MESYPRAAVERAMKVQEVILRAMAKKITWAQAGEIIGLCERQMRRWKERYLEVGYEHGARAINLFGDVSLGHSARASWLFRFDLARRCFHQNLDSVGKSQST